MLDTQEAEDQELKRVVLAINAEFAKLGKYPMAVEAVRATQQRIEELSKQLDALTARFDDDF